VCQELGGNCAPERSYERYPTFAQHRRHVVSERNELLVLPDADTRTAVIANDRRPPNLGWNATATRPGNAAAWGAMPSLSGATLALVISAPWYPRPERLAVRIRRGESIGEPCPTNEASLCLRPQRSRRRPSRWRLADAPPRRPRSTGFYSGLEPHRSAQPLALEAMRRRAEAKSLSSRPATCPTSSQLPLEALEGSPCATMVQ
jgi:hypothetical protein